jgi:plastocyanin
VVVGGDAGLVYTPEFIMASIGDTVEFTFMKSNHSVTQSAFAKPCVKLATGKLYLQLT